MNYIDTNNDEEIKILELQLLASTFFIITTLISIFITYNERQRIKYKKGFIDNKYIVSIVKANRVLITIILTIFVYIGYKTREFDKERNNNITPDNLELISSYFSLIGSLIILYVVFKYGEEAIVIVENPDI